MKVVDVSIAVALLCSAFAAHASAGPDVERLKLQYLACDEASRSRPLASGEAQACSVVAEALLQHGFQGDVERLLDWWRSARRPPR